MQILVIGGAGYIGSHVTRTLLDQNHGVCVFDNMATGLRENLFPEADFVHGDIRNSSDLRACMKAGFDAVVHLAALKSVGESMSEPERYSVNNICGTINILNAATELGINRFVFSSSAAVYGEPDYVPVDEEHPTRPESYYGFTKLEIERILRWYYELKELRFVALRYFNAAGYDPDGRVFGLERKPNNLLPRVMEVAAGMRDRLQIFGDDYPTPDGTCVRDYIHVTDLAEAHVRAIDYTSDGNNESHLIVNLGSESGISVREMIESARRITGRPIAAETAPRRPGDPAKLVSSAELAKRELGWTARYSDVDTLVISTWKAYERALSRPSR